VSGSQVDEKKKKEKGGRDLSDETVFCHVHAESRINFGDFDRMPFEESSTTPVV
jgi:hypothetical protein